MLLPWHYRRVMRKVLLVLFWFPATFILLLVHLAVLSASRGVTGTMPLSATPIGDTNFQLTASAGTSQVLGAQVIAGDARSLLLQLFLERHNSPMAPFADAIVTEADKNGIDYRLITAIAMCESNLGKRMPTRDSYNAWGIAVYTGKLTGATFDSWQEAITWVSRYIKEKYYDRGIVDLKDIGAIWAPPSVEKGYSWTNCVEGFRDTIY